MYVKKNDMPLYLQVKDDIVNKITDGQIQIGDKLQSENEMIGYYQVGRVTVRNALASLESMGCVKKERGKGTFCISIPSTTRRISVDVLIDCKDTYIMPFLLAGISRVLERENCNLMIHDNKNSKDETERILQSILERGTDGIIIQEPPTTSDEACMIEYLDTFKRLEIPTVCICGKLYGSDIGFSIDDKYGTFNATRYLIDCGHKRIIGCFPKNGNGVRMRHDGIIQAIGNTKDISYEEVSLTSIDDEKIKLLQCMKDYHPTALVCYNDFFAVQVMHILQQNGYSIPNDISIIGFDDSALAISAVPQLTTLAHPKDHMGSDAAKTILMLINGTIKTYSDTLYRPELVIRQTVCDLTKL